MRTTVGPDSAALPSSRIVRRFALAGTLLLQAGCTAIAVTGVVVGATVGAGAAVVGTAVGAGVGAGKAVVDAMTDDDKGAAPAEPPAAAKPPGRPADAPAY